MQHIIYILNYSIYYIAFMFYYSNLKWKSKQSFSQLLAYSSFNSLCELFQYESILFKKGILQFRFYLFVIFHTFMPTVPFNRFPFIILMIRPIMRFPSWHSQPGNPNHLSKYISSVLSGVNRNLIARKNNWKSNRIE